MRLFRIEEFIRMKNPNPGKPFKQDILTRNEEPDSLGGIFGILEPGTQVPYHVHNKRHTVIIAISGEATAIIEGKEIPIKTHDVLHISPGEKHMTVNKTNTAFRYLGFFTFPSLGDIIEVK